jgi:hypothetical protein
MSRLLSFVSGLSAAVSLVFLALSIVVVGPLAYANTRLGNTCNSGGNCRGLVNSCNGQTAVCDSWIEQSENTETFITVKCFCDGHNVRTEDGQLGYVCDDCHV